MKRDFELKRRVEGKLPPEQLLAILQKIYPNDNTAQIVFDKLMKMEEEDE